jgi:exopolysaccharide production protein ExoZ
LFFVISGVVIGLSTPPEMSIREFLVRRFIRIFPLYWLATWVWIAYTAYFGGMPNAKDLLRSLLLLPVLSAAWVPTYFPAWTLEFEIFFYLAFACCMLAGRLAQPLCCIVLLAVALALSEPGNPQVVFDLAMMLLEFIAGMIIAMAILRGWVPGPMLGALLISVAVILFAANATPLRSPRQMTWGIPAAMLVFGFLAFEKFSFFRSRAALLGGNASYAIYLFHITLIYAVFSLARMSGFAPEQHRLILGAIVIPASLAAGALICLAIDRPLLKWLRQMLLRGSEGQSRSLASPIG